MSEASTRHDPFAALRFPEFRNLITGAFLTTMAILVQEVALAYELYKLTRDPLTLGFIGLAEAIPFIGLALFGGHVADRYDKRRVMQYMLLVIIAGSTVLTVVSHEGVREQLPQWAMLLVIYAMFMVVGFARGFYSPASASLKAFLVPREHYANSATWSSTFWQAGAIVGPVAAGFLYAGLGLTGALLVAIALFAANFLLLFTIRRRPPADVAEEGESLWQSLGEGLRYVWNSKIILYSISLDMFSVLFGGVVAILPIFAEDILKVGPEGLGLLRAAPAVGAMLTVLLLAWYPPTRHAWRNMLLAVLGFGLGTLVFALSDDLWLSLGALFFVGAADSVSVVIRGTVLQTVPPDHLRGRVLSVNSIFVASSNELGAFESGVAARLMGVVPSVIFGSGVTLLTVAYVWRRSKELFKLQLR
ncbi:MFS transporter [Solimonas fluminis]|uniref:Multidrug efflux pump Tap n=1 Tax=Solimonas fluminis TaxID=2086571 RepID=A0A2S5TEI0_9GAMM|nr:MFS transporter [Solimonas fluminis]PPE73297.1 MFS transporter [Solimonas fluminis]